MSRFTFQNPRVRCFSFSLLVGLALAWSAAASSLVPGRLRCESLRDPLGVDMPHPRLSWIVEAATPGERGLRQSAYQVIVSSTLARLQRNDADLWDSGKTEGPRSIQMPYQGEPLTSGQPCFWKVRVWDQAGEVSAWSEPARWSMGLLHPRDWKGPWIGLDETSSPRDIAATWIWFPEGNPAGAAPVGERYFRRVITIPSGHKIQSASCLFTADNEFVLYVNGEKVGGGGNFHAFESFDLNGRLHEGDNLIAVAATNAGADANPAGLIGNIRIEFEDGTAEEERTDHRWRSSKVPTTGWNESTESLGDWVAAAELGQNGMGPWGKVSAPENRDLPARQLRREFVVEKPIRRATAYVCGLGLFEFQLNGRKIGDHVLEPALSEYEKRVYYVTFDVTSMVREGRNAAGIWLGNGRYFAPRLKVPTETRTYGYPKLRFQLNIEYADGQTLEVTTDDQWKLTTQGPIRANNEYDGEIYDARLEQKGWSEPGFDDSQWQPAREVEGPKGELQAQMIEPIRITQTLQPAGLTEPKPGVFVFDMGQNMVGWCRIHLSGPRGQAVTLRHAEVLQPDGTLYVANLRSAKAADTYMLSGNGPETYEPRFTYHGFRYVEITGWPGKPTLASLEGRVVHDDVRPVGTFACSNPLLNHFYQNVRWGVRGNYRSMPTDCPQRDERQGWLGDRSAESKGESYLFDIAALYAKWVGDMADAQKENGSLPDVAPAFWPIYSDNITWPSSAVIIPGMLHEQYDDRRVIASHYDTMKRWLDHMSGFLKDGLMPRDQYGDWCVPPESKELIHSRDPKRRTDPELLASAYFYHDLRLMAQYARLLERPQDVEVFEDAAARLKTAFNRKFFNRDTGFYSNGTQTSCVLPLAFGLVPEDAHSSVFQHLVEKITRETGGHIGTGLVGGQWLMRVLSQNGRADLAYELASQTTYPSWGYMIENNATTVWELWNGNTADPAMNSHNHVMLVGDFIIWCYEDLAGIRSDPRAPGFQKFILQPHPVDHLEFVRAAYESPHGQILSHWRKQADGLHWDVEIPANTTATVFVPVKQGATITEAGHPAAESKGVRFIGHQDDADQFEIGSGRYAFVVAGGR